MVVVEYDPSFVKLVGKIKDSAVKEKVKKQIMKIVDNPECGKPMRYARKGTRELYVSPYRLAYAYFPSENKIVFLDIYHKDEQ